MSGCASGPELPGQSEPRSHASPNLSSYIAETLVHVKAMGICFRISVLLGADNLFLEGVSRMNCGSTLVVVEPKHELIANHRQWQSSP